MKKGFLLFSLIVLVAFNAAARPTEKQEWGDLIDALPQRADDYTLTLTVPQNTGVNVIDADDIVTFIISHDDGQEGQKYDIYYYLDSRYSGQALGVVLPYNFKQTYRGMVAGEYQVMLVAVDPSGKIGKVKTMINVTHDQ